MEKLLVYLLIGGIFAGLTDKWYVEERNKHLPVPLLIYSITLWAPLILVALITDDTVKTENYDMCEGMRNE